MASRFYYGPTVDPGYSQFGATISAGMNQGFDLLEEEKRRRLQQKQIENEQARMAASAMAATREAEEAQAIERAFMGQVAPEQAYETVAPPPPPAPLLAIGNVPLPERPQAAPERRLREGIVTAMTPDGPVHFDPRQSMEYRQRQIAREETREDEQANYDLRIRRIQEAHPRLVQEAIAANPELGGERYNETSQQVWEALNEIDFELPWEEQLERLREEMGVRRQGERPDWTGIGHAMDVAGANLEGLISSYRRAGDTREEALARISPEMVQAAGGGGIVQGIIEKVYGAGYTRENAMTDVGRSMPILEDANGEFIAGFMTNPDGSVQTDAYGNPVPGPGYSRWLQLAMPLVDERYLAMTGGLNVGGETPSAGLTPARIEALRREVRGVPRAEAIEDLRDAVPGITDEQINQILGPEEEEEERTSSRPRAEGGMMGAIDRALSQPGGMDRFVFSPGFGL